MNQDTIYDMGCGIGAISKMLADKARLVIAIDNDSELIQEANRSNPAENISYQTANLASMNYQNLPTGDGIWSSFIAAYFPDITPILNKWISILKAWGSRFDRMHGFKAYVGEKQFYEIKYEFLECLSDKNHMSNAIVKYLFAKKTS